MVRHESYGREEGRTANPLSSSSVAIAIVRDGMPLWEQYSVGSKEGEDAYAPDATTGFGFKKGLYGSAWAFPVLFSSYIQPFCD